MYVVFVEFVVCDVCDECELFVVVDCIGCDCDELLWIYVEIVELVVVCEDCCE